MKRRMISVLLTVTMIAGLCGGCGKSGGNSEAEQNENSDIVNIG